MGYHGRHSFIYRDEDIMPTIYDFQPALPDNTPTALDQYRGKVVLIVNTASKCGFTPQYQGLEKIYREFKDKGVEVLGFPCNQFGGQEPGNAKEIAAFCETNYDVTFPMFDKIDVNGANAHPLYNHIKGEKSGLLGSAIKWNFTKFVVDRAGKVVARHAPTARPEGLRQEIEALL